VPGIQVLAFVVSAACAGLGGGLLAYTTSIAAPDGFPLTLSIALLAAAVIGGLGSLAGAILGGVLIVYVPQWATSVSGALSLPAPVAANLANGLYGLLLITVVLFLPGGLHGGLQRVARLAAVRLPASGRRPQPPPPATASDPGAASPVDPVPDKTRTPS